MEKSTVEDCLHSIEAYVTPSSVNMIDSPGMLTAGHVGGRCKIILNIVTAAQSQLKKVRAAAEKAASQEVLAALDELVELNL